MLKAVITMNDDHETIVHAGTIEGICEKIRDYHTMSTAERTIHERQGVLEEELSSGWYFSDTETVDTIS